MKAFCGERNDKPIVNIGKRYEIGLSLAPAEFALSYRRNWFVAKHFSIAANYSWLQWHRITHYPRFGSSEEAQSVNLGIGPSIRYYLFSASVFSFEISSGINVAPIVGILYLVNRGGLNYHGRHANLGFHLQNQLWGKVERDTGERDEISTSDWAISFNYCTNLERLNKKKEAKGVYVAGILSVPIVIYTFALAVLIGMATGGSE